MLILGRKNLIIFLHSQRLSFFLEKLGFFIRSSSWKEIYNPLSNIEDWRTEHGGFHSVQNSTSRVTATFHQFMSASFLEIFSNECHKSKRDLSVDHLAEFMVKNEHLFQKCT